MSRPRCLLTDDIVDVEAQIAAAVAARPTHVTGSSWRKALRYLVDAIGRQADVRITCPAGAFAYVPTNERIVWPL